MISQRLRRGFGARLHPQRRPSRRAAVAALAALVAAGLATSAAPASAANNPSPPFHECPAVGNAHGCAVLLVFQADGSVSVLSDPSSGNPYDGSDDTEVGVLNDAGVAIPDVTLTSNTDIFGFDGDGICSGEFSGTPAGCPFDTTEYAGPGVSYSGINANKTAGVVTFADSCTGNTAASCTASAGLDAGASAFFSLEENLTGASIVIPKASPAISSTTPSPGTAVGGSISDSALLANGRVPDGTLTFDLYGPADPTCQTPISVLTAPVDGNAAYSSGGVTATAPGTYRWTVSYGGDANNNPVAATACGSETVTVTKASPTLGTTPSASVPVGGTVSDTANLAGSYAGTGNVVFSLYAPGDTDCQNALYQHSDPASGDGAYSSGNVQVTAPGTYDWVATYSGDANNDSAVSGCGKETVRVTPQTLTGRAYGLSASTSALGLQLLTVNPTPDTGAIATTAAETVAPPCVVTLSGLITSSNVCAKLTTSQSPAQSIAQASIDSTKIGLPGVPVISVGAIQSQSSSTCAAEAGNTTIAYLSVGGVVVIAKPTVIAPNTKISVLGVSLILNEQIAGPGTLTVNAVHVKINALGLDLVNADVVLASSTSDIENCP
ncbi:choice-of-anchor P family protein [Actinospica robiniae]|uniref:choice-of-anchor P family protein n=1 Tax=Actinospica robiniae TaxID=304901 RepID=UPI000418F972|nr:choice-of-anchor P family protein [Actinospica robiniae]